MPVYHKLDCKLQMIINDCGGNQLHYNNDLPAIGNKNYALQKPFKIDFFDPAYRQRETATDHTVAQGTRFCTLTFFDIKLFTAIILS